MNQMLSEFYDAFLKSLPPPDPPPDPAKFDVVFALLDQVRTWKPAKKVGKRVYDDKAFVESVKKQAAEAARPLSARQLAFLVRMVAVYADQIPDAQKRLREVGLGTGPAAAPMADPELVKFCFDTMDRIGGMDANPFLKSLREQYDSGKPLSMKQFSILAKSVGDNAGALEDADAVRERLSGFVAGGFAQLSDDPQTAGLLDLAKGITEWRPKAKRGKKVYDDELFIKSLSDQFARRHSLSARQVAALKRVLAVYSEQIPDYDKRMAELGLAQENAAKS